MSTSAVQLRRLLALLPRISDGRAYSLTAIAGELGVDAATVIADLRDLSERYGDPPGWIEKIQVYIEQDRVSVEAATHFRRPMRLSSAEWRALALGLALLRAESSPDRQAAIDRAVRRLRDLSSVSSGERAPADGGPERAASVGTPRHLEHVPALRDALRERRRVSIWYQKASGDAPERRTVCPFVFVVEKGIWYLVAHCDRSDDIRIFRLDRIRGIELLGMRFEPRDVDLDALLGNGTAFVGAAPERLTVRFSPRIARWIAEREQGTLLPDGSYEVVYPLADADWAVRHVLQYGPEAEVVAPDAVRQAVIARLENAMRMDVAAAGLQPEHTA